MLAYPTENNKGKFIAIFWSIFNLGGVVGAAVSLGQNYDSTVSLVRVFIGFWVQWVDGFSFVPRGIRVRLFVILAVITVARRFADEFALVAGCSRFIVRRSSDKRDLRELI